MYRGSLALHGGPLAWHGGPIVLHVESLVLLESLSLIWHRWSLGLLLLWSGGSLHLTGGSLLECWRLSWGALERSGSSHGRSLGALWLLRGPLLLLLRGPLQLLLRGPLLLLLRRPLLLLLLRSPLLLRRSLLLLLLLRGSLLLLRGSWGARREGRLVG